MLVNITGGSDIKLFEVDAAVNKIRAEVDPEAELIFGAIKDENMDGKIRVSIVATALHGSETRPYLNLVNNSSSSKLSNKSYNLGESLFTNNLADKHVSSSIDGATALKLDESYEIKSSEEQNALIDRFENKEEIKLAEEKSDKTTFSEEIPSGVSIESASYMENNVEAQTNNYQEQSNNSIKDNIEEEYTPKLFSDENNQLKDETKESLEEETVGELFNQDTSEEEDFEIPAFLRRQKF